MGILDREFDNSNDTDDDMEVSRRRDWRRRRPLSDLSINSSPNHRVCFDVVLVAQVDCAALQHYSGLGRGNRALPCAFGSCNSYSRLVVGPLGVLSDGKIIK